MQEEKQEPAVSRGLGVGEDYVSFIWPYGIQGCLRTPGCSVWEDPGSRSGSGKRCRVWELGAYL